MSHSTRRTAGILLIILGVVALVVALSACSSPSPDAGSTKSNTPAAVETANVIGTWESESENGTSFVATVENGQIQVDLVSGETKSLFWKGTFPDVTAPGEIKSVGDREALDSSMMGSSETEKPFTFTGDELNFEFSMMGTSTIVHTTKK